jgi:hypothetical protein
MYITMNEQYRKEKEQFSLKDTCEDCSHYCAERNLCAMLYPVKPHLTETFNEAEEGERIYFCKMFEAN